MLATRKSYCKKLDISFSREIALLYQRWYFFHQRKRILKPELDRFIEEETGRGIEVAIAGLEEPGRPMKWKRASFDERATPRSGF
jgi:hypothetical protein